MKGNLANAVTLAAFPKWTVTNLTYSFYTTLPGFYTGANIPYPTAAGPQLYSTVFNSAGLDAAEQAVVVGGLNGISTFTPLTFTPAGNSHTSTLGFGAYMASHVTPAATGHASPGNQVNPDNDAGDDLVDAGRQTANSFPVLRSELRLPCRRSRNRPCARPEASGANHRLQLRHTDHDRQREYRELYHHVVDRSGRRAGRSGCIRIPALRYRRAAKSPRPQHHLSCLVGHLWLDRIHPGHSLRRRYGKQDLFQHLGSQRNG